MYYIFKINHPIPSAGKKKKSEKGWAHKTDKDMDRLARNQVHVALQNAGELTTQSNLSSSSFLMETIVTVEHFTLSKHVATRAEGRKPVVPNVDITIDLPSDRPSCLVDREGQILVAVFPDILGRSLRVSFSH
jgi:hypothetical protein